MTSLVRLAFFAWLALPVCAGCKSATPPAGFGVNLTIDARSLSARTSVASLDFSSSGAESFSRAIDVAAITAASGTGVVHAHYIPGVDSGSLSFGVNALDANGALVGTGTGGPIELVPGRAVALEITLGDAAAGLDLLGPPDMLPLTCTNGVIDPGETDLDCGGPCAPCEPGKKCVSSSDCVTEVCTMNLCELASGPPSWVPLPSLPANRTYPAAASLDDGRVYLLGGEDGANVSASVLAYSLETNDWTAVESLAATRSAFPAVVFNDKIIVLGGFTQAGMTLDSLSSLAAFTPGATPAWANLLQPLSGKRYDHTAALAGGRVYVAGGRVYPSTVAFITFESFDPASDTLSPPMNEGPLPGARFQAVAVTDVQGHVVLMGGKDNSLSVLARVDVYDPGTKTWSRAPDLNQVRDRLGAALGPDGRIYAVAGASTGPLSSVEVLPSGGSHWLPAPSLAIARWGLAVTRGWDGRIYAIGGANDMGTPLSIVEAYGPRIIPGPSSAQAGKQVAISGSNFGANAKLTLDVLGRCSRDHRRDRRHQRRRGHHAVLGLEGAHGRPGHVHAHRDRRSRSLPGARPLRGGPMSPRRLLLVLLVLLVPLGAQAGPLESARVHARRGTALYSAGKYLEASAEFEEAYAARPDGGLLFNAAQAARLGGDLRKAQTLYSSYVSFHPDGASIDEARRQLDKLDAQLKADEAVTPEPPPQTITVSNPPSPPPRPSPPPPRPIYKRWWLWTAVVGGAGVVAAGVTLGIVLTRPTPAWTNVSDLGPGAATPTSALVQLRY